MKPLPREDKTLSDMPGEIEHMRHTWLFCVPDDDKFSDTTSAYFRLALSALEQAYIYAQLAAKSHTQK